MEPETLPGLIRADHVGITIPDLDDAVAFYTTTLGGVELFRQGPFDAAEIPRTADGRDWTHAHVNVPGARLRFSVIQFGEGFALELFEYEKPLDAGRTPPRNCDVGGHHLALRVHDIEAACAFLRERGVRLMERIEIDEGPAAGLRANYFLDPWGNHFELVEYTSQG